MHSSCVIYLIHNIIIKARLGCTSWATVGGWVHKGVFTIPSEIGDTFKSDTFPDDLSHRSHTTPYILSINSTHNQTNEFCRHHSHPLDSLMYIFSVTSTCAARALCLMGWPYSRRRRRACCTPSTFTSSASSQPHTPDTPLEKNERGGARIICVDLRSRFALLHSAGSSLFQPRRRPIEEARRCATATLQSTRQSCVSPFVPAHDALQASEPPLWDALLFNAEHSIHYTKYMYAHSKCS